MITAMPLSAASESSSLRDEHRGTTRRRIISGARKVFIKKGYAKATIEDIIAAARVSRATLYLHFDSKLDLMHAASEKMAQEGDEAARRLARVLMEGDRAELREWVEWALLYYIRYRPMALAAREAELSEEKPAARLRTYLECMEPWVETWPVTRRTEARMRFELCRLQMHHYMWGTSPDLFDHEDPPVDLFTEMWWNTLKEPMME
jgi:AcrR family transcriptional regulator